MLLHRVILWIIEGAIKRGNQIRYLTFTLLVIIKSEVRYYCGCLALSLCIDVLYLTVVDVQKYDLGLVRNSWSCLGDAVWNRANCFEDGWC